MTRKLNVKFIDFKEYTNAKFGNLREDKDFADVTLACEDGQQVEAHKVILAGTSPFFQNLLRRNKHPHPLVYMRNVSSEDLLAVLDFLYYGEANLDEQNLQSFLALAEELQLKGLSGETLEKVSGDLDHAKVESKSKFLISFRVFLPLMMIMINIFCQDESLQKICTISKNKMYVLTLN